jgi:hypothetical protein
LHEEAPGRHLGSERRERRTARRSHVETVRGFVHEERTFVEVSETQHLLEQRVVYEEQLATAHDLLLSRGRTPVIRPGVDEGTHGLVPDPIGPSVCPGHDGCASLLGLDQQERRILLVSREAEVLAVDPGGQQNPDPLALRTELAGRLQSSTEAGEPVLGVHTGVRVGPALRIDVDGDVEPNLYVRSLDPEILDDLRGGGFEPLVLCPGSRPVGDARRWWCRAIARGDETTFVTLHPRT